MKGTQTVSEQAQSEQQQKVEQERSKLVTYTVKLPNGVKVHETQPSELRQVIAITLAGLRSQSSAQLIQKEAHRAGNLVGFDPALPLRSINYGVLVHGTGFE